jgi:hypothetical protein
MVRQVLHEAGKVTLEHDAEHGCFIMHWFSYHGPHYRQAIEALLKEIRAHGAVTYISDASRPTDIQSQEDLAWIAIKMKEMPRLGVKRVIVVQPSSFVAKMGSKKLGQTAASAGLERVDVNTLAEALSLVRAPGVH